MMSWIKRLAPLVAILVLAAALYFSGALHYVSMDSLKAHQIALQDAVAAHPITSLAIYMAVYAAISAACLPLNLIACLTGGLLFGPWVGGISTAIAATVGSLGPYFAARSTIGVWLRRLAERRGGALHKIVHGFGRHAFSYILSLRLVPVFPFWFVSLAAGIASPPMWAYLLGTAIGSTPSSVIFSGLGSGLGEVFARGDQIDASVIFAPHIILPLLGLALLSLAPVAWRRFRRIEPS